MQTFSRVSRSKTVRSRGRIARVLRISAELFSDVEMQTHVPINNAHEGWCTAPCSYQQLTLLDFLILPVWSMCSDTSLCL